MAEGIGVRSSKLDKPMGMEVDTTMSKPSSSSSSKPFHALAETWVLEEKHMKRFRKRFQFLAETNTSI